MNEYPIARLYADVRVGRIYGGANEVMKEIIARAHGEADDVTRRARPHFRFWPKGVARELVVPRATLPEYLDVAGAALPGQAGHRLLRPAS